MIENKYYDGNKLLTTLDLNGNKPEIYICTSNRTAGKTTYFNRLCVNKYKANKEMFVLLYRYNYELDGCAKKFFGDIQNLFFPNDTMYSKPYGKGLFHELYFNDVLCGYALAINQADQIKKHSHLFSKVQRILFDEFQSETNTYCANEVNKFISIHTSIARGNGEQVRYVPVYMLSNPISLLNPYYTALGISERLTNKTKILRGNGFVLEQGHNEYAAQAQKLSPFNQAFSNSEYIEYAAQGVYLNDNYTFVEKINAKTKYIATVVYNGNYYSIKECAELGVLYCDSNYDNTFPIKISITTDDMQTNYVMLKRNEFLIKSLKYYFDNGCFRFRNLKCKECVMKMLSY